MPTPLGASHFQRPGHLRHFIRASSPSCVHSDSPRTQPLTSPFLQAFYKIWCSDEPNSSGFQRPRHLSTRSSSVPRPADSLITILCTLFIYFSPFLHLSQCTFNNDACSLRFISPISISCCSGLRAPSTFFTNWISR